MVSVADSQSAGDGLEGRVVGFIDIGTNSVRLMVVRISSGRSYQVINLQREVVRLGEEEFADHLLRPAADRARRAGVPFLCRPRSQPRRDRGRRGGHLGDTRGA